ncbi:phosphomannomutase/phosphoglucomutase [Novilysobacter selenitireducens]|uniref:phosphomannomutase n=1 Tax=Novilysobacter selenitireducens TaxID=2872639 RepID=A0ABS7T9V1_9GAMM|nr:phosphomannomutase/phosphoglucomutase [Lysobacter selenitireducens]MBZ4040663.1 phosphomannomutase/phosphoglucomutase [Lysobacter selenitireducens]
MVDLKIERPQLSLDQLRPLRPVVIALALLLAAWLAFSAWQQQRDGARRSSLTTARDVAAQSLGSSLSNQKKRLVAQMQNPGFMAAVRAGEFDRAGALLTDGWPGAQGGMVVPADLEATYAGLDQAGTGGYGRLAALEAALAADEAVVWMMGGPSERLAALAAPVDGADGEPVAVALAQLPLERLAGGFDAAPLGDGRYLALRQGSHSVLERGDDSLAGGAEVMAVKVPGSELRVAAAVPPAPGSPFGLGLIGTLALAVVALLVALLAWRPPKLKRATATDEADAEPEQTLAESMQAEPTPTKKERPIKSSSTETVATGSSPVAIDRGIFRAYDIRGIVGQSLDPGVAELIGHAIGSLMHEKGLVDIVVGRDGRLSGPDLVNGLVTGLRRAGRNVVDIGLAPTPLTYFGAYHLNAGSCVSVTGSHNPPDYNGFKIVVGGETLSGDAITDLYARIADDRLHTADAPGGLESRDISEDYVQRVAADVQIDRPLKVVVDAGNGVAGELGPRVLAAIGAEVTPLYCEIDGTFPNHHPDPSEPENLADLIKMVARLDADLGLAFDGDGDRLGVVTRDGHNIFPDRLLMLFAADVLERNPGAMIIYDVKCTGRLPGHILRHGGSPLMWKTGHSLIKAKMRETDAELAGEMSGHFFFKERWYGFDDGIYAAARLLEILAARPQSAAEQLAALPDGVATAEIKVDAPGGNPHAFVERFVEQARFEGARLSTIDGLRVDWPDGWGLVRASNTTPVLVLRFDADNNEAMARIKADFKAQILAVDPDLSLPF